MKKKRVAEKDDSFRSARCWVSVSLRNLCKLFDECDPKVPVQAGRHEWRFR
jgi:hypothetical protein